MISKKIILYKDPFVHNDQNSTTVIFRGDFQANGNSTPVAVKRIPTNSQQLQEAKREAKLLDLCDHQNILTYHGATEKGAFFYIVTELCKETLEKFLDRLHEILEYNIKREILLQVTRGLDYLHRQRIVHRDIKPANIFIANKVNDLTVSPLIKLADFGSAIQLNEGQEYFSNTNNKNDPSWGTKGWMAPELYSEEICSSKMDIFSLGLVFAYTLSKERNHAFESKTMPSNVNDWKTGQPNIKKGEAMTLIADDLDIQDLVYKNRAFQLIKNMLHINPDHRWAIEKVLGDI